MTSTKFSLLIAPLSLALVACSGGGDAPSENDPGAGSVPIATGAFEPTDAGATVEMDGQVRISVDRLVSESEACLLMMQVENGTDQDVNAGLFAFNVTGNGETAGANMFPQSTPSGEDVMAQIVLQNASCDDALQIEGGQIACTISGSGESCTDQVLLEDDAVTFASSDTDE